MAVSHSGRAGRTTSGGRYRPSRKKRHFDLGRAPSLTTVGALARRVVRMKGGGRKSRLLRTETMNLYDPSSKKYYQAKITKLIENTANRNYVRRNVITLGAVVETEKGKARITSRPGQHGTVNGVLVLDKKEKVPVTTSE